MEDTSAFARNVSVSCFGQRKLSGRIWTTTDYCPFWEAVQGPLPWKHVVAPLKTPHSGGVLQVFVNQNHAKVTKRVFALPGSPIGQVGEDAGLQALAKSVEQERALVSKEEHRDPSKTIVNTKEYSMNLWGTAGMGVWGQLVLPMKSTTGLHEKEQGKRLGAPTSALRACWIERI